MLEGSPFDLTVNIVDPFARLTSTDLAARPSGPNTTSFDLSALDYTIYDGFVNFIHEPLPTETSFFDTSDFKLLDCDWAGTYSSIGRHSSMTR